MSRRGGEAEDGGECEEGREKTEGKKMGSNRGREGKVEIMTLKMTTRDGRQWMWIEGIVSSASQTSYNLALPSDCVIFLRILRNYSQETRRVTETRVDLPSCISRWSHCPHSIVPSAY